jgi:hypothetical protein
MTDPSSGHQNPHLIDAFGAALENVSAVTGETVASRQTKEGNAYQSHHVEQSSFASTDDFQFLTSIDTTQDNAPLLVSPDISVGGKVRITIVQNPTIDESSMNDKEFHNLLSGENSGPDGAVHQSKNVSYSGGEVVGDSLFGTADSGPLNPPTGGTPQNEIISAISPGDSVLYQIDNLSGSTIDLSYNQVIYEQLADDYV